MNNTTEIAIREILFYAECVLQSMIAENKQREATGKSMAYSEDNFIDLAESTSKLCRAFV